ncbi:hypothetical protein A2630_00540 [Candidatus Woesebacteria bacterium RIFCSPHIGHO2_01_FULL_44_10]|uniref:S-adenosylmethionine decarboxylase proenzyme n=1 Tax=Candidatus Woesebacteria bacterium RIFCSPLOWO2_01_FULL_44_14 TaxID=1802525 RepID=A0A1F8C363_9BACT|nr:MAG: hypothetical protein A2630_00540 [Candidatus Woesebacteria bacterium RIFCSPHIGHO2_01_FULL_44_10]OGM54386.1 MAG: hypothetical protein A3F62_01385 [Candidatus Woesebacteria bacterium RIFCSPHIGHO2_12_FULL_44_11]OGM70289.1 MAG: hypothetical protein A2975_04435 [Candidatus Woesebacteria bacterium RIFCSPLOWO2_01_FULL_44_14]
MINPSIPTIEHHTALIKLEKFPNNQNSLEQFADKLIESLNLTVVKSVFHSFKPQGKTLVYILSESHLAIHTWPEYKLLHIDLVSCVKVLNFENSLKLILNNYGISSLKVNPALES